MIASQARLKSQLTEKGATLPSATMRTKQATGSTEVQQLPRLRDYAPGTDRMALWQRDVRKAASGVSKGKRAQGTSDEHDRHMWALNEYAKRRASTRGTTYRQTELQKEPPHDYDFNALCLCFLP